MMKHQDQLTRLDKVTGQLAAIRRMVEDERYCVDILNQLRSAIAALRRVEDGILRGHMETCVRDAMRSGSQRAVDEKLDEIFDLLGRVK